MDGYEAFLTKHGLTEDEVQLDMALVGYAPISDDEARKLLLVKVAGKGFGITTRCPLCAGQVVGSASRLRLQRHGPGIPIKTFLGRFTNHSDTPNMLAICTAPSHITFVAARKIEEGEELTVDYNNVVEVRTLKDKGVT